MKHRTYKYAKYGAVIVAAMLLMALPMTVMAQKNTEAAAAVEIETTTEASTKVLKSADKDAATSENAAAKGDESKTDKITDASENAAKTGDQTEAGKGEGTTASTVTEDETKTSDTTKVEDENKASDTTKAEETTTSGTAKDTEEETAASEKSTEDVVDDQTAADESGTESKQETESATDAETDAETETETAAATETETETTAAETTAAELKSEAELASGIIGTWSVDDSTGLSFGENNKGKLIIPDEDYAFSYKLDGDQLTLDFVSSKATDGTYTASLSGDTLTLTGGKGTIGGTFELNRN